MFIRNIRKLFLLEELSSRWESRWTSTAIVLLSWINSFSEFMQIGKFQIYLKKHQNNFCDDVVFMTMSAVFFWGFKDFR